MSTDHSLILINIAGLTPGLLGEHTPNLSALAKQGVCKAMQGVFPAVTTTVQSSMLTGLSPAEHGIVGNGWYFRDQAEVKFWLQSNHLVQGEKVWQSLRKTHPDFRCSNLFWWYNMYSDVDFSVTPRPHYPADGSKIMGLYSEPSSLHRTLEEDIGEFPFFNFWGPASDIRSSRWIVDCGIAEYQMNQPNLQLVYLPHLDYNLQRLGPNHPDIAEDLKQIDHEAGRLIDFAHKQGADVLVVSEYGISEVTQSVSVNRLLRTTGLLRVRESLHWELLDPGASRAFAVADHQCAHVYIRSAEDISRVRSLLENIAGIDQILDRNAQRHIGLNHPRSGELVLIAEPQTWFDYYYWLDDNKAPDFARTVDIHRKPGYDPLELFVDPTIRFPHIKVAKRLLQKKLGQRMLMDMIPLTPELTKGSHGRLASCVKDSPLLIANNKKAVEALGKIPSLTVQHIKQLVQLHFI